MNALSDPQLLRAYAERRSEAAFEELVRRHIDLVHSAAVRMVNDPHLAKDVSQGVFVALAKDAGKLTDRPVLSGWLHRTARKIAAQTIRTEVRRRTREKEAATMNEFPETDASWEELAPHLDAVLAELSEPDRDAVLLRYFENKPAQEMAAILGVSAEAAQKRVSRAVEKLREIFAKRGITTGASGLGTVISTNAVQAAPSGLAGSIASCVGAKIAAFTLLQKIAAAVAILSLAGVVGYQQQKITRLEAETGRANPMTQLAQTTRKPGVDGESHSNKPADAVPVKLAAIPANSVAAWGEVGLSGPTSPSQRPGSRIREGSLPSSMMEEFGLTKDQFVKTQEVVSSHWRSMAEWAAKSIYADEAASKADADGAPIYRLPAMSESARKQLFDTLARVLRDASNDQAANAIVADLNENMAFSYMGRCDVIFRFTVSIVSETDGTKPDRPTREYVDPNDALIEFRYVNPKTGFGVVTGSMSLKGANQRFGNIFKLDK